MEPYTSTDSNRIFSRIRSAAPRVADFRTAGVIWGLVAKLPFYWVLLEIGDRG